MHRSVNASVAVTSASELDRKSACRALRQLSISQE